jgi:UDP-N-acetylglucosamine/UDP-N-acetylgalactosamine diphosphorylase
LHGSELSSQVVRKKEPMDRVGNVVEVDGRLHVIEYSDLPDEVAERRNPDGSLAVWAGSIAVHVMNVAFLQRMADTADALPFHIAHKKVTSIDSDGRRIQPEKPNAIKFERFIFDLMPSADRAVVVEVDPVEHFAPLKNAPGEMEDTPQTVKAQLIALHSKWLARACAKVRTGVPVEISPQFALDAEQLEARIEPDTEIVEPTYFSR